MRKNKIRVFFIIIILLTSPFFSYGLDISKSGIEHTLKEAVGLIRQKKYEKALSCLISTSKADSNPRLNKRILFLTAYTYLKLKRYDDALHIFKYELLDKYSIIGDYVHYFLAKTYSAKGSHKEALAILYLIKKRFPYTALISEIDFNVAQANISLKIYGSAVKLLTDFIKRYKYNSNIPAAITLSGKSYEALKMPLDAYKAYQKIYINFPLDDLAKEAEYRMMIIDRDSSNNLPEPSAMDVLKRINNLMAGRMFKKAISELGQIIRKYKDKETIVKATFNLGRCYIFMNKDNKGINILKNLAKEFSDHRITPRIYYRIAKTYWNNGDTLNSILYCNQILERFSKGRWAERTLYLLGRIYEEKGEHDNAVKYYTRLVKKFPDGYTAPEASWRIGWTYYIEKEYVKSIKAFNRTVRLYKSSEYIDNALYWEGRAYEQLQNKKKAKEIFIKLAKQFPYSYYGHIGKKRILTLNNNKTDQPNNNNDIKIIQFPLLYENALAHKPQLNRKAEQLIEKAEELMILGLHAEAKNEVDLLSGHISKKDIDSVMFLGALYFKVNGYTDYFKILNRFMNIFSRKGKIKRLPLDYWRMYYPLGFWEEVYEYSKKNGIDPFLIEGLIRQESVFDYRALSKAGARGLMQLIPSTAKREIARLRLDIEFTKEALFDPALNIALGTQHFKRLIDIFSGDTVLALISYNAGTNKAYEWKKRFNGLEQDIFVENIPYPETRAFVKNVMRNHFNYKDLYSYLF